MKLPSLISGEKLSVMARLAETTPPGDFLEVGVYKGGSSQVLYEVAQRQKRTLYLYDTFTGIPYQGENDSHRVGDFSDSSADAVKKAMPLAIVQAGTFPSKEFIVPESVAFVHLDVDQEKSYLDSFEVLFPKMVRGGMILCDDYCLSGAAKAIDSVNQDTCVKTIMADGRALLLF